MKKILMLLIVAVVTTLGVVIYDNAINPAEAATCRGASTGSEVIKCGVWSANEMRDAYNSDRTPGTKNIFSGMGITSDMVNKSTVKEGTVGKDGRVIVDGKVVATNAWSSGRTVMSHTTQRVKRTYNGTVYYESPTSDSFRSSTLASYVFFDSNGRFQGAVILDCGNPVRATPTQPKPTAVCTALDAPVITNRTSVALRAHANTQYGGTIKSYVFTIADASGKNVFTKEVASTALSASTNATVTTAGKYTAKVVVKTSVGDSSPTACQKPFTIAAEPKPKTPSVKIQKYAHPIGEVTATVLMKELSVKLNQQFLYRLYVTNDGEVDLKNVVVSDNQPSGIQFISAKDVTNGTNISVSGGKINYSLPSLPVGKTVLIEITAKATESSKTQVKNTACVNAPEVNPKEPTKQDSCDDASTTTPEEPVVEPKTIEVCRLEDKKYPVTIKENEFDETKYSMNPEDCKEEEKPAPEPEKMIVCNLETKKYPDTIKKEDFDKTKHSEDADDCKKEEPKAEVPAELPQTGPMDGVLNALGLGALVTATLAYVASRRNSLIG